MKGATRKRKGFTLLEIIVVMIIIGVLAAIALPNMFGQVERNRSQGALNALGSIRNAVEACIQMHGNAWDATCGGASSAAISTNLGVDITNDANFTYAVASTGGTGYTITATRTGASGGTAGETITQTRVTGTGAVTCAGTGHFVGVCT